MEGRRERVEPLDRAHDLSSLSDLPEVLHVILGGEWCAGGRPATICRWMPPLTRRHLDTGARLPSVRVERVMVTDQWKWRACSR
jgi:hypothetical protein